MTRPTFRFAPSPNGRLHLGHAYSALLNQAQARRLGGRLLIRIEDIDPARCRPEWEAAILDDLDWLGIRSDEPVRRQSEHMADYAHAFETLRQGGLVYPCACARGQIARDAMERWGDEPPRDPDGAPRYPGRCRGWDTVSGSASTAWRLDAAGALKGLDSTISWLADGASGHAWRVQADPVRWGDAVVRRKDVPTSYHLAVVVDDALQGVTHVVRGGDLEAATDLHALLQRLLGLPSPRYHHHALILDPDGAKLAKSRGSPALAELRAQGVSAGEVRRRLGF